MSLHQCGSYQSVVVDLRCFFNWLAPYRNLPDLLVRPLPVFLATPAYAWSTTRCRHADVIEEPPEGDLSISSDQDVPGAPGSARGRCTPFERARVTAIAARLSADVPPLFPI
jgi:hypothetical protein